MANANTSKIEMVYDIDDKFIKEIEDNTDYKEGNKYSIDYISVDLDFISSRRLQNQIRLYGSDYFFFYCYLKNEMCNSGNYYFLASDKDIIIQNFSMLYRVDLGKVKKIFQELIQQKLIFVVNSKTLGEIITDPYVIYNYRLTMEKRVYNRKKKQEERAREKTQKAKLPADYVPKEAFKRPSGAPPGAPTSPPKGTMNETDNDLTKMV